jgi:hypothetical protein
LADTAETVVTPLADAADTVVVPLADSAEAVVTPLTDAADALVTPVADATESLTAPVTDATEAILTRTDAVIVSRAEMNDALAEVAGAVTTPVEEFTVPIVEATDPITTPVAETVEALTTEVAKGTETITTTPTETLTGVVPPLVADVPDAVAMPTEEIAEIVGAGAESVEVVPEAAGTGRELATSIEGIPEPLIPLEDLSEALMPIAITLGIASLGATAVVRGGLTPAASIAFTNVRLIPCMAADTVHRIVPSFAGRSGSTTSGTAPRGRAAPSGRQSGGGVIDVIREGFDRSVGRVGPDEDGEGLRDARLLAQLGIVLGMIYVSFLTLWFWATRLRWNPRKLT